MKLARVLLAAVAVASITQSASAQFNANATTSSDIVKITSFGPFDPYGVYTGQLLASPGQPTVDLLCNDFVNGVLINTPWNANFTRLDAGAAAFDARTRFGSAAFVGYQKAAYLTNFFAGLTNPQAVLDLHSTIWHLLTPGVPSTIQPGEAGWLAVLGNNWVGLDLTQYFVVSDPNMVIVNGRIRTVTGGNQEFLMHTVPEPGSVLMLSTGLLSLVGLARFRRRRNNG